MIFIGVPVKSNDSRNLFSKYLVYEKCANFGLLQNMTNVGGLIETWEANLMFKRPWLKSGVGFKAWASEMISFNMEVGILLQQDV